MVSSAWFTFTPSLWHTSLLFSAGLLDQTPYNITVTPLFHGKTGHGVQTLQMCSSVGGSYFRFFVKVTLKRYFWCFTDLSLKMWWLQVQEMLTSSVSKLTTNLPTWDGKQSHRMHAAVRLSDTQSSTGQRKGLSSVRLWQTGWHISFSSTFVNLLWWLPSRCYCR